MAVPLATEADPDPNPFGVATWNTAGGLPQSAFILTYSLACPIAGWLGDRWSRRHMMVIFFVGIGASMIAVGLVQTPLQLGAALLSIGLFASIYHPVGTAMIVSYADRLGREICKAPTPRCALCPLKDLCPTAPRYLPQRRRRRVGDPIRAAGSDPSVASGQT